jgi:hypothetical protein
LCITVVIYQESWLQIYVYTVLQLLLAAVFSYSLNLKFRNTTIISLYLSNILVTKTVLKTVLGWNLYLTFPIILLKYKHFGRWLCFFHENKYKNSTPAGGSVGWNKSMSWIGPFWLTSCFISYLMVLYQHQFLFNIQWYFMITMNADFVEIEKELVKTLSDICVKRLMKMMLLLEWK